MTKIRIVVRGVILLGIITTAIIGCGGDDVTKSNDDDDNMTIIPKPAEPEADKGDKEDETAVVVEPAPQEPEPESEPVLIGNPRANEPPEPQEPEPEPEPLNLGILDYESLGIQMKAAKRVVAERLKQYPPEQQEAEWESELFAAYIEIFQLADFTWSSLLNFVWKKLLPIYQEENPHHRNIAIDPLLLEYLRLQSQFPLKTEAQLLELFRESVKVGNISAVLDYKPPQQVWAEEWKPEPPEVKFEFELGPGALAEDFPFLEEARAEYYRRHDRWQELVRARVENALVEGWGFEEIKLIHLYQEEKPGLGVTRSGWRGLMVEYIRLSLEFPEEPEEGLLRLLRERVRAGEVVAHGPNPKPTLEPDPLADRDVYLEVVCKIINRESDRINDEIEKRIAQNPGLDLGFIIDDVYKEVFGIGEFFMIYVLKLIVEQEMPDLVNERGFAPGPFLYEYLALKLAYPKKEDHELIELFRISASRGNISEIPGDERPTCQ